MHPMMRQVLTSVFTADTLLAGAYAGHVRWAGFLLATHCRYREEEAFHIEEAARMAGNDARRMAGPARPLVALA